MAREDATVAAVIGTGFQAETQLEAIAKVRTLREVRVWSRKPEKRTAFVRTCSARFGLHVVAAHSAQQCVEGADIVVTATSSKQPVLEVAWLRAGAHVNATGANWADRRELPEDLIFGRAAILAVDSLEVAKLESGDILIPMKTRPAQLFPGVELSDIVAGRTKGRENQEQITVFKSNGMAIEDVAVAGYVYEQLLKR